MDTENLPIVKIAKWVGGIALLLVIGFSTAFRVQQNEIAVIDTWGKFSHTATSGLNFKMPVMQGVTFYRTDLLQMTPEKPVNTYTVDNQEIDVSFTINYTVPASKVEYLFTSNRDYKQKLYTRTIATLKSEMGEVNIQHVAQKRGELEKTIRTQLAGEAEKLGLSLADFQLTDLEYVKSFREAVNAAAVQKANIEAEEYKRQAAEKTALAAQVNALGTANAAREAAKGKADGIEFVAVAEAKAIKLKGEAEAQAIKAQADALANNRNLVALRQVEKWSGNVPTSVYNGTPIPLMNMTPAQ